MDSVSSATDGPDVTSPGLRPVGEGPEPRAGRRAVPAGPTTEVGDRLARRRPATTALARAGRGLVQDPDSAPLERRIAAGGRELLDAGSAVLFVPDAGAAGWTPVAVSGETGSTDGGSPLPERLVTLAGLVAAERGPVWTPDLLADARLGPDADGRAVRGPRRSALGVPLLARGRVAGVLAVGAAAGRVFDGDEIRLLEIFADQATLALDNARLSREVETRDRELAERWELLQTILGHLDQGVSVIDRALRLVAWNHRFLDLLGFPRELGERGRPFADFARYDAERGEHGPGDPEAQVARLVARARRFEPYAFERVRPDGRVVEVRGRPMRSGDFVTTYADVTERKEGDEALRRSEAQLRQAQKMDAVGRLAGGVAHDFNNLLTVISGRSELLLRMLPADDPRRRHADLIQQTAFRAADLTRQLLAFSRKQVLQPRILDLNTVVGGMEGMLRRLIGEHIELACRLAPALGRVKADPNQIEQVVVNLVVNARDAMPHGGVLTLETADVDLDEAFARSHVGARPGPHVLVAVTDTGMGMDAETRGQVFEPFFTTKGPGKGTGLGLATVYGIVKQSGGYVWVESEAGQGARFAVYLPRIQDAEAESPASALASSGLPRGTETVLLVEDQDEVRDLARELLEMVGYRVLEARHGREALQVASAHEGPVHLLLTDVVMPHMGGRELASHLLPARPEMRVLYMSGYTDDAIVHHGVLDPGTDFIQKPFAPEALARRVREALDAPRG